LPLRYIGVLLSIASSISSNLGVNMQKYSMTREASRPGEERAYICQPLWGIGLVLVITGSLGDFAALGFAAQSLAVPVGALTMVANVIFAHFWLGENLSRRDMLATFLVTIGVILTAAFGDKSAQCYTMDDLLSLYTEPTFLGYVAFVLPLMMTLYFLAKRADNVLKNKGSASDEYGGWRKIHSLLYPILSGFWGAQSVLFAKSIAEMVKLTARGHNQFTFVSLIIAICMVITVFTQIHFLAQGLQHFDAIFVVPVFQSAFIVGAILVGATYFKEFSNFSTLQIIFFPTGISIVILGVMLLSLRKMSSSPSIQTMPDKDARESEMLFTRRKVRADVTPGVVQLFRDLKGKFVGGTHYNKHLRKTGSWHRGQNIPTEQDSVATMKNSNDMALETLDELDELEEINKTVPINQNPKQGIRGMHGKYVVNGSNGEEAM
jgi:magnesium transporter